MEKKLSFRSFILLALLFLIIVGLIICSFAFSPSQYEITAGIITLVCILVIIALSNSFDNFSIGAILSISREAKENKEKVKKLEKEKSELLLKLVNINFQSQNASNNLIISEAAARSFVVQEANQDEIKEDKKEENTTDNIQKARKFDSEKLESLVLGKYYGISKSPSILRNVKVVTQFQGVDPISDRPVFFDAYYNDSGKECFIEITRNNYSSFMLHDRLYIQLNKIYHYRNSKNSNAMLILLVAKFQEEEVTTSKGFERIKGYFAPAITSGLINIQYIELAKEEYEKCYE